MEDAGASLDAKVAAALAPAARMTDTAAARYAEHAAQAIAPVVVAAAASVSTDNRGRVNHVIETVASYGARFPTAAQVRYVELARRGHRAPRPRARSVGGAADQQPARAAGTERRDERERGRRAPGPDDRGMSPRDAERDAELLLRITRRRHRAIPA